jgi:hypothetical protein
VSGRSIRSERRRKR